MQLLIMKKDIGSHKKGDIVEIRASGTPFGGKEPDAFVMVEIPGEPMKAYKHLSKAWERELGFTVVSTDLSTDTFVLQMSPITGGTLSLDEAKPHIEGWGGKITTSDTNSVTFSISVYDALTSQRFWELPADKQALIKYLELSYDQSTGIHQIQADYSSIPNNPTYIENWVDSRGLEVVSNKDKVLVYNADREVVRDAFQKDMQEKLRKMIARRKYSVPASVVDTIIAKGGTMSVDKTTALSYVQDKAV